MRVAFVGKGGAGKSTVSTLFFLNLVKQQRKVICFDADLNIHIPKLLGMDFDAAKSLSTPENTKTIKDYLRGNSAKIFSTDHFYKTTPPSQGACLFELSSDNPIINTLSQPYQSGYVAAVGTYHADEIGRSCYHTNLSVLENILSFARLQDEEWIVTDMVAGIDAFSNTLHHQFDVLFLVVEPTRESLSVFDQYLQLATQAGIARNLMVVGNKIEDETDVEFIRDHVGESVYLGGFDQSPELKKYRQQNRPLTPQTLSFFDEALLNRLTAVAEHKRQSPNQRLKQLHQLHRKYIDQDYVKNAVGDLSYQIDKDFAF